MQLGRVCGQVVSTKKTDRLYGFKILVVQPVSLETFEDKGAPFVSLDGVGAGDGELVMCVSGSSSRQTGETDGKPVDNLIVAIIDSVDILGTRMFDKANPDLPVKKDGKEAPVEKKAVIIPDTAQPAEVEEIKEEITPEPEKPESAAESNNPEKEETNIESVSKPEESKRETDKQKRSLRQKEEIEEASLVFKFSSKPRVEKLDDIGTEDEEKTDVKDKEADAEAVSEVTEKEPDEPVKTEIAPKEMIKETVLPRKKADKSVSSQEQKVKTDSSDLKRFDKKVVLSSEDNIDTNLDTIMKKWNEEKEAEAKKAERSSNKNNKPRH